MAKIERLKRITVGRIRAFLGSAEKPEQLLPRLITELTERLNEVINAEAKALSAVKAEQRRLDEAIGRLTRLENGAKLAVAADDMETARQAVAAQIIAEKDITARRRSLEAAQKAYESASAVRQQLQDSLTELKNRKTEFPARLQNIDISQTASTHTTSLLDEVAQMEDKIEQTETRNQIHDEISKTLGPTILNHRLDKLQRSAEVEKRLNELKQQHPPKPENDD